MKFSIEEKETNVKYDDLYDTLYAAQQQIAAYEKDDAGERDVAYRIIGISDSGDKLWFAVVDDDNDAWDTGSYDYVEALEIAKKRAASHSNVKIAYIHETTDDGVTYGDFCEGEEEI